MGGDGKGTRAYVHVGTDYANAFYLDSCNCLGFGDGNALTLPLISMDFVAHEMTHGVTAATAKLDYAGESGGLNEATSDIFGTLAEFATNNPVDRPDYVIGERIRFGGVDKPVRYMDDPIKDGYSSSCWTPILNVLDPHYSSGVGNKFFYTLAVGSGKSAWGNSPTCNRAPAVAGIGNQKAGRIWYRALTLYMVSNTNYSAARMATLEAADDLYGADSTEYAAVKASWNAVGVDGTAPATGAPLAPRIQQFDIPKSRVGDVVSSQIVAKDPQGDSMAFTATGLPRGLSISASGLITGTLKQEQSYSGTILVTDSTGEVAAMRFTWLVTAPGDQTYTVTAKASNTKPKAAKKISITGMVKPARANTVVVLQRLVGKKWVKVTTTKTTANGSYKISRAFTKGTWKLRVRVSATKSNAKRANARLTVKAK